MPVHLDAETWRHAMAQLQAAAQYNNCALPETWPGEYKANDRNMVRKPEPEERFPQGGPDPMEERGEFPEGPERPWTCQPAEVLHGWSLQRIAAATSAIAEGFTADLAESSKEEAEFGHPQPWNLVRESYNDFGEPLDKLKQLLVGPYKFTRWYPTCDLTDSRFRNLPSQNVEDTMVPLYYDVRHSVHRGPVGNPRYSPRDPSPFQLTSLGWLEHYRNSDTLGDIPRQ